MGTRPTEPCSVSSSSWVVLVQMHDKLLAGLRWYASARLVTQVVAWLGTIYVVRALGPHALGAFGVTLMVTGYLSMVYDGSLLEALIQRPPGPAAERRAAFTLLLGIAAFLAAVMIALAHPVARWVGDTDIVPLIGAATAGVVLGVLGTLPHALLAREMRFTRLAAIDAVQSLCVTGVSVALAALGAGVWALVSTLVTGPLVRLVMFNHAHPAFYRPVWRLAPATHYLHLGGTLLADNLLWRWYTSVDTLLLGRWSGTTQLGFYSLAQQLAELPLEKVAGVVNDISLPAYTELKNDRPASRRLMLETMRLHALLGFPVFWGLAAVSPYAVAALYGPRWHPAVWPLTALAAIGPIRLMGSIETPALTGLGRPGVLVKTKLLIVPAMTVALAAGCRLRGIDGAALAWLLAFPLIYAWAFRWVLDVAGVPYRELLAVIRAPAAAAAAMVVVIMCGYRLIGAERLPPAVALAFGIGLGVLLYPLALRWVDPAAYVLARSRLRSIAGVAGES